MKKAISIIACIAVLITCVFSIPASATSAEELRFSQEYMTSPYYEKLIQALEDTADSTTMERTLAVALSQEGYLNYATEDCDLDQARAEGKLWTGAELRMSQDQTGNTEYTRWAQRYILGLDEDAQYADYDWCAIFVSWCLYQAGYYDDEALKKYFYSYAADPRIFYDADSWYGSFNCNQRLVYYTPLAHHKLEAMDWNTYYNVDVDPYDIPYKPGGIIFFNWNGTGDYFSHVALVVSYDTDTHVLTYANGNFSGMVKTSQIDLDEEESYSGSDVFKNAGRIMAYADYDKYTPPEQKEIHAQSDVISWDKSASSGIRIQTDSESILASVYIDDRYHGSIIESNMIYHEGLLAIGKSELVGLSIGKHKMKLVFDDGELELDLIISDKENAPDKILGDADGDGVVSILDATVIQQTLAAIPVSSFDEAAADADGDENVTILDVTAIQRCLAELSAPEGIGEVIL